MDVREKLVELIKEGIRKGLRARGDDRLDYSFEDVADYLISNGVTVQGDKDINVPTKWIPVTVRLPEIVSTHKRCRNTIKKSIRVLCVCVQKSGKTMVKEGYCEWYNDYQEPRWQIPGTIDEVTHWQYLPQPPKGE